MGCRLHLQLWVASHWMDAHANHSDHRELVSPCSHRLDRGHGARLARDYGYYFDSSSVARHDKTALDTNSVIDGNRRQRVEMCMALVGEAPVRMYYALEHLGRNRSGEVRWSVPAHGRERTGSRPGTWSGCRNRGHVVGPSQWVGLHMAWVQCRTCRTHLRCTAACSTLAEAE